MKFLSIGRKDRARQVFPKKYCLEMPNIRQKTKPTDRSCVNPRLTSPPPREKKKIHQQFVKIKDKKEISKENTQPSTLDPPTRKGTNTNYSYPKSY